jgi:hypothetical protein
MDGQTERVNQILEDMLRACVLEHQGSWDHNLPWAEFSYNNIYQESLIPPAVPTTKPLAPTASCGYKRSALPSRVVTPGFKAKPDAHRMYAQDQVVIHTVRM